MSLSAWPVTTYCRCWVLIIHVLFYYYFLWYYPVSVAGLFHYYSHHSVIIGFLVAELSPFPSGSVAVKLGAHYSNDHTHIYTATATISPSSTPTSGTHPHSPSPPPGPRRRQNKREGERAKSGRESFEVAFHRSESAGRLPETCHLCREGIGKSRFEW